MKNYTKFQFKKKGWERLRKNYTVDIVKAMRDRDLEKKWTLDWKNEKILLWKLRIAASDAYTEFIYAHIYKYASFVMIMHLQ